MTEVDDAGIGIPTSGRRRWMYTLGWCSRGWRSACVSWSDAIMGRGSANHSL